MSIRDLRTFLAIAEAGSFAAAARAVRRTQSAVSMQMKQLEAEMGLALFDRTRRPPVLSDAGRAFVDRAREAVAAYDRLLERRSVGSAVEGHLRLGAVPSVMTGLLPPALVALRGKYPGLHVELTMGLSAELVERVRRGALDAAIVSELLEARAGLAWTPFAREPLVLIAPATAPEPTAEALVAAHPFIRYSRQAWVGQLIDQVLERRRMTVDETMALDTLEAVAAMVAAGLGVSIVPVRAVGPPLPPQVRTVALPGAPVHRTIGLLSRDTPAKAGLVAALLGEISELVARQDRPQVARDRAARVPGGRASALARIQKK